MKTLVVLAVMVATTAHQACGIPVPGTLSHGTHAYGYGQAPYLGRLASSVPASVPVSDNYELAAARDQFFRAYQDQLNTIYALRATKSGYHDSQGRLLGHHGSAGARHASHGTHSSYGTHAYGYGQAPYVSRLASSVPAGVPVSDTYELAAARDQFFRAYQDQLNTIYAIRATKSGYHDSQGRLLGHHGSAGAVHASHGTHSSYGTPAVHDPVVHTSQAVDAPVVYNSHAVHAPVVHASHAAHASPAVHHKAEREEERGHTAVYIEGSREARHSWALLPFSDMKTLVVLAVMVATTAHQAYGIPVPGIPSHGTHAYGYGQAPYVGPLASSVPAGIGGKVIPVSDTYEVAAARDQFFRAYQDQLNTIYAIRANRPAYHNTYGYGHGHHAPVVHTSHAVHAPVVHTSHAVRTPVVHTSHAVHAPVVHTSHAVHASPAVHHNY
ncbi:uncharacterized protein LOC123498473 [Portunus trituberculatus]|uniref:uncharacterized protein LOC123498473 n=1 Tax=Portunus trituberculatus TaxID=210409 RepID=UPI001E1CFEB2|nr:uncharacterized protein LOC123498473 [Portunus trituberculatus]